MNQMALDPEGFLVNLNTWTKDVAEQLAISEGIHLSEQHWEVIYAVRQFYQTYEVSPAMRPLVKYLAQHIGKEKGNSIYLLTLFPGSPAKLAAKIAGLPKPENCL